MLTTYCSQCYPSGIDDVSTQQLDAKCCLTVAPEPPNSYHVRFTCPHGPWGIERSVDLCSPDGQYVKEIYGSRFPGYASPAALAYGGRS
jgi:hypothetical protein